LYFSSADDRRCAIVGARGRSDTLTALSGVIVHIRCPARYSIALSACPVVTDNAARQGCQQKIREGGGPQEELPSPDDGVVDFSDFLLPAESELVLFESELPPFW